MNHLQQSLNRLFGFTTPAVVTKTRRRAAPSAQAFTSTDGGRYATGLIENKDCAVRAVALLLDKPYAEVHAAMAALGRKPRSGTAPRITEALVGPAGYRFVRCDHRPTYAAWLRAHPTGRYIAWVTGHVFMVEDGKQHDNGVSLFKPRARMVGYYEKALPCQTTASPRLDGCNAAG